MVKNYKAVLQHINEAPDDVRRTFSNLGSLIEEYNWDVPISYAFARIEEVKRMTIYCGIVKMHRCDSEVTWNVVSGEHMTRARFKQLFQTVFDASIEEGILQKLERAEKFRDKVMHGMDWQEAEARSAIVNAIDFAGEFNEFVHRAAGFRPFGSLRGFKGAAKPLSAETTRWVLRGMGLLRQATIKRDQMDALVEQ